MATNTVGTGDATCTYAVPHRQWQNLKVSILNRNFLLSGSRSGIVRCLGRITRQDRPTTCYTWEFTLIKNLQNTTHSALLLSNVLCIAPFSIIILSCLVFEKKFEKGRMVRIRLQSREGERKMAKRQSAIKYDTISAGQDRKLGYYLLPPECENKTNRKSDSIREKYYQQFK